MKKIFISYLDEDNKKISGYFELIVETLNNVKIRSGQNNILTIPFHRILKIKEHDNKSERRLKK